MVRGHCLCKAVEGELWPGARAQRWHLPFAVVLTLAIGVPKVAQKPAGHFTLCFIHSFTQWAFIVCLLRASVRGGEPSSLTLPPPLPAATSRLQHSTLLTVSALQSAWHPWSPLVELNR